MTGLLVALLFFTAVGFAGRNWGERYLLGMGITGAVLFVTLLAHLPVVPVVVLLPLLGLVSLRRRVGERRRYPWLATTIMLIPVAIVFVAAMLVPLMDFDGRVFWVKKAKAIAHERAIDGPFFRGEVMETPRNHYPLLVPIDDALLFAVTGESDDRQIRGLYALTFLALLLVVRDGIARASGNDIGSWCAAIVAWLPPFAMSSDGGARSAYNDIPLAAFAAGAFFEVMEGSSALRLGTFLAAMTLTKSEGLPLALILLAAAVPRFGRRVVIAVGPFAIAVIALFLWRARVPATDADNFIARLPLLPSRIDRFLPAVARTARHMVAFPQWGLFWIAVAICCVIALLRRVVMPVLVLVTMLGVYIAAFMITTWPLADLVDSSVDRLLMHLIAPAMFVLATAIAPHYQHADLRSIEDSLGRPKVTDSPAGARRRRQSK